MKGIEWDNLTGPDGETVETPSFNSIYIMATPALVARRSRCVARRDAWSDGQPSGDIIEQPITANFREGLTALQYFIDARCAQRSSRYGAEDYELGAARRLVDVARTPSSPSTTRHLDRIDIMPLIEAVVIEKIGDRILGNVSLEDVVDPMTGKVCSRRGTSLMKRRSV